jgi:hypothetical protein
MRIFYVVVAVAFLALTMSSAPATEAAAPSHPPQPGPLKPGRTAGVRAAQQARAGLALVGAGAIIAVVVVAGTGGSNGNNAQNNMQTAPVTTTP